MLLPWAQRHRPPGRCVDVRRDDAFIVSYPKSGNTWVRFTLASILRPDRQIDFTSVHDVVPDIYRTSRSGLNRLPGPRLIKSHEYFDPRYPKVIYLVRDPRDVVLSYFHYEKRKQTIGQEADLEAYVDRFLAGELDQFGSWREHVGSWLGARLGDPRLLLVRYEDLTREPVREFARMVDFVGLPATSAGVEAAVQRNSFAEMRRIEMSQARQGTIDKRRLERPFLRSGRPGAWLDELPAEQGATIAAVCEPVMTSLGYLAGGPHEARIGQLFQALGPEAAAGAGLGHG
jgi:hypothetical protein